MPEPVEKVPDPWERYKDGQIWRFTEDEWRKMPGFMPIVGANGQIAGDDQMMWFVDGHHYVRFFDFQDVHDHPNDWPRYLAGWIT